MGIPYERGLSRVGPTTNPFFQARRGWGWSNAGLVGGREESLPIDTFFDLPDTLKLADRAPSA